VLASQLTGASGQPRPLLSSDPAQSFSNRRAHHCVLAHTQHSFNLNIGRMINPILIVIWGSLLGRLKASTLQLKEELIVTTPPSCSVCAKCLLYHNIGSLANLYLDNMSDHFGSTTLRLTVLPDVRLHEYRPGCCTNELCTLGLQRH
jgi:hypothetical protein